ncbi:MAG: group II intron reverse transcriptase/maturase [Methanospirillaceae archaeon]|nr:group II intron reverse transcriptase/maturase [Methanospirillaceae archaeon]
MDVGSSKTLQSEDLTNDALSKQWDSIPIEKAQAYMNRLQTRIAKAVKQKKFRLAKRLQYLVTHSFYAKVLAVKTVTKNDGKNTPGIDGEIWLHSGDKMKAVNSLSKKRYRSKPLKRVFIPKPGTTKMRPLSIPTMFDRAVQALYALGLQPWAETTADKNSFGFRKGRSAQDASVYAFTCLSQKNRATWVIEGDIKGCFDNISHEWLMKHIPMDKKVLNQFLKSGFIHENELFPTEIGTPQGGLISPILANMTLDGLQQILESRYNGRKVNFIRYADDFLITAESKELAEEIISVVQQFLCERGLELSLEKTRITHINEGFDFLGWNFRKYRGVLLIKPSKKSIASIIEKIRITIARAKAWTQDKLISLLNPIIRGWTNYHHHIVATETFSKLDHILWNMLWTWAKRRHPEKGRRWVSERYWQPTLTRKWTFRDSYALFLFSDSKIVRHPYLKMDKNPFLDQEYFEGRKRGEIERRISNQKNLEKFAKLYPS